MLLHEQEFHHGLTAYAFPASDITWANLNLEVKEQDAMNYVAAAGR
jgi:hypothetical protein